MKNNLYPLKFKPILKEKVWGGQKLKTLLKKQSNITSLGESWEISAVNDEISIVDNGSLKGQTLTQLLADYKEKLVGQKVFEKIGENFPLLFKFIDAKKNLSLQVHPDDRLAKERHDCLGKTEMWYVLQADKDSGIYAGFAEGVTEKEYLKALEKGCLQKLMNFEKVFPGDVFFIKPGLVHAIGEGVLLAEIQQSSDITYRVFDWNRQDIDGNFRQLHTKQALGAIDFHAKDYKIEYKNQTDAWVNLVENKYFRTRKIELDTSLEIDYTNNDSFVVYMCVKGELKLQHQNKEYQIGVGESMLLPAVIDQISLKAENSIILEITA